MNPANPLGVLINERALAGFKLDFPDIVPVRIAVIEAHDNFSRQISRYDLHLRRDLRKGREVTQLGCDRVHDVDVVIRVSVDVLLEHERAPISSPVVPYDGPTYRVRDRPRLADSIG